MCGILDVLIATHRGRTAEAACLYWIAAAVVLLVSIGETAAQPKSGENSEFGLTIFGARFARPSLLRWDTDPWGNSSSVGCYRSLAGSKQTLGQVSNEQTAGICGQRYGNIDER